MSSSLPAASANASTSALVAASGRSVGEPFRASLGKPPVPRLPWGWGHEGQSDVFEVPPLEVARQMTLLDFALFVRIPLNELHGRGWLENGGASCPRLMAAIALFNNFSRALSTAVLASPTVAERAAQVAWWLRVVEALVQLRNYSSAVSLMAGLAASPVHRLRRTWEALRTHHGAEAALHGQLEALTASAANWSGLRSALRSVQPPCVPYMGVYCSDLTFCDQGNPSRLKPHGLVNWDKARMEAGIIREVNLFQLTAYKLEPVTLVQELLLGLDRRDDDDLYARSLAREPRPQPAAAVRPDEES